MDNSALFTIPYGLFAVGVTHDSRTNACIINTAAQAASEPQTLLCTMLKSNLTTEMIAAKKSMAITVLSSDCSLDFIAKLGMKSGRDADKMQGLNEKYDNMGNPYFPGVGTARISVDIDLVHDLGSHLLFSGRITEAEKLCPGESLTYTEYRNRKAAGDRKKEKKYVCSICHYVYSGEQSFESLPDDWICPICKKPKSVFVEAD